MENQMQTTEDQNSLNNLYYEIGQIARWGKFLSIVGLVSLGILLVFFIIAPSLIQGAINANPMAAAMYPAGVFIMFRIFGVVAIAVAAIPTYYLYKFSTDTQKALNNGTLNDVSNGMAYLRRYYQFIGIVTIVILSINILTFIISIIMGVTR